jgi:hypothetical protein
MKSSTLWDITPCSSVKINRRFGRHITSHLQGRKLSQARNHYGAGNKQGRIHARFLFSDSSMVKMEAIYSAETSVDFHRPTRRYIPEERTLIPTTVKTSNPENKYYF